MKTIVFLGLSVLFQAQLSQAQAQYPLLESAIEMKTLVSDSYQLHPTDPTRELELSCEGFEKQHRPIVDRLLNGNPSFSKAVDAGAMKVAVGIYISYTWSENGDGTWTKLFSTRCGIGVENRSNSLRLGKQYVRVMGRADRCAQAINEWKTDPRVAFVFSEPSEIKQHTAKNRWDQASYCEFGIFRLMSRQEFENIRYGVASEIQPSKYGI